MSIPKLIPAATIGSRLRVRYFKIAATTNGTASTTSDVLMSAEIASSTPIFVALQIEGERKSESMHQHRAAASIPLVDVSQIRVELNRILSGNQAHTRAANFPAASPTLSRPQR